MEPNLRRGEGRENPGLRQAQRRGVRCRKEDLLDPR